MKNFSKIFVIILALNINACSAFSGKASQVKQTQYKVLSSQSEIVQAPEATNRLESHNLNVSEDKKKVQIALFFPFSGKNRELAWHLFNASVLSLFENDLNHNIELVLIDSKDSPHETEKAFKEIIDRKIKIVIGPIFSQSAEAIEKEAKTSGITVISFSNNPNLIGKINNHGGIFLAGLTLESQINQLVNYAIEHDKTNFAIIAPQNQFGILSAETLKTIVLDQDGNFIISELYNQNDKDIERATEKAVNSFSISSKLAEGGGNKLNKKTVIKESDRLYTQVIMVPESGKNLFKIAQFVKKYNTSERPIQLIGTNQWDDIATANNADLSGAWFTSPESSKFHNFEQTYYKTYKRFPPRISSIAYDLVAAISTVAEAKKGHVPTVTDLTNYENPLKNGFDGVDGLFRFLPNGLVQRNLAILEVRNGYFDTIEKPNEKFLKYK